MNKPAYKIVAMLATALASINTSYSDSILWSKDLPDISGSYSYVVGSDGAVATTPWNSSDSNDLSWYSPDGNIIATLDRSAASSLQSIHYLSQTDLVYEGKDAQNNRFTVVAKVDPSGQVSENRIDHLWLGNAYPTFISFPYYLTLEEGQTLKLRLLSDTVSVDVVGDVIIGSNSEILHIRWGTKPNSIYRIETSIDMETWVDYSGEIQGDGTTKFAEIPVDSDTFYARVIQI